VTGVSSVAGRRRDLPTGTVTFLFSDIEGSTRLVQEVGPDVFRAVLEDHNRLLRGAFSAHGGVERGTQGDSFAVIFREGPAAVAAAVEAQRALAGHAWPARASVRVRIGLHTGIGVAGGDDYVGVDIHRAARIAGLANGGQTLLSDSTRSLVARDLPSGTWLRDLGMHRLRDLAHPEQVFELVVDGVSPTVGLRAASAPGNLPPALGALVGRDRELAQVERHLEAGRLVTITGPGGIGKTSLAIALARRVAARFPNGTWLVRLESVTDPGLVDASVVDALGIRDAGMRTPRDRLEDFLREATLVLVLDNLEQLPTIGTRVVELLQVSPGIRVVATSRAPLGVMAEQVYPIPPLALEPTDWAEADAARLFTERARRARPDYAPDRAEQAAIAAICRRVDGLPLGIELAAAQIRLLPARTIQDRIERSLDLPAAAPADLPSRHRTLRDTVAWSYELLDAPARSALARLSVTVGGFRLEEAEAIGRSAAGDEPDMLAAIATLSDHSLLMPRPGVDGPRFAMLDTIRSFATERLESSGERRDVQRRHALAYLALAEAEASRIPGRDQAVRLVRLTEDHDNLRAAVAWAIETAEADIGLRFAAALWRFWQLRGHLAEAHEVVPALLSIPGAQRDDAQRLRAMEAAGGIEYWRGDMHAATLAYREQVRIGQAVGDGSGEADGWFNLAHTLNVQGQFSDGASAIDRSAELYARRDDERGLARAAWAGAATAVVAEPVGGAWDPAVVDVLDEQRRKFEALDDFLYAELCAATLAWVNLALGNLREAARWGSRTLRGAWEAGDVSSSTFTLRAASVLAASTRQWVEAATLAGAADEYERRYAVQPPMILDAIIGGDDTKQLARDNLGTEGFDAAVEAGHLMTIDEAVDYALRFIDSVA